MNNRLLTEITEAMGDSRMPPIEPNPLQKAYDEFTDMRADRDRLQAENADLRISNQSLLAEVSMLKELLRNSDNDRVRFQSISSTLTGQLLAINAVIADSVRLAQKNGLTAVAELERKELEQASTEAAIILERTEPRVADGEATGTPLPPKPSL